MTNEPTTPEVGGEWIEWHGGENPVPGQMVQVRWRDNSARTNPGGIEAADQWSWAHHDSYCDIIAYRLVSPPAVQEEGLKPCPMCGGKAHALTGMVEFIDVEITCTQCALTGGNENTGRTHADNLSAAIAAWNRRPSPAIPDREEIASSLRTMLALVLLKYGNLDADVNVEVEKAQSILQGLAKLEGQS